MYREVVRWVQNHNILYPLMLRNCKPLERRDFAFPQEPNDVSYFLKMLYEKSFGHPPIKVRQSARPAGKGQPVSRRDARGYSQNLFRRLD